MGKVPNLTSLFISEPLSGAVLISQPRFRHPDRYTDAWQAENSNLGLNDMVTVPQDVSSKKLLTLDPDLFIL